MTPDRFPTSLAALRECEELRRRREYVLAAKLTGLEPGVLTVGPTTL
jgi:hypothetical protein